MMKKTLERLWHDYLMDECAVMDTEEEKRLTEKAAKLHEAANTLLCEKQKKAIEKYVDALCDIHALFVKKAFCKGCEFTVSFLWEANDFKK